MPRPRGTYRVLARKLSGTVDAQWARWIVGLPGFFPRTIEDVVGRNVDQRDVTLCRGFRQRGELPGGLGIERRAPGLHDTLTQLDEGAFGDPLAAMDWLVLYALAVNEENAAGGRVVTAPTNGAAGVIPAVLSYYDNCVAGANEEGIVTFLLLIVALVLVDYEMGKSMAAGILFK